MTIGRAELRSSLRALLGAWAGDRSLPLPPLPANLPATVVPIVQDAITTLAHYQGVGYARLYLHRLRRFIGRIHVDDDLFAAIARLMAERMAYQDPVRLAQIVLGDAARGAATTRNVAFRLDELIEPLPSIIARPLLGALEWCGWSGRRITCRYSTAGLVGRTRLRVQSSLRFWRVVGVASERERVWIERWLHMIDRTLTKQPAAAAIVVETATMVQGHGDGYRQGLADWNLLIDSLVKPGLDGALDVPDLATAIATARAAAGNDPQQAALTAAIKALRGTPDSSVASRAIQGA